MPGDAARGASAAPAPRPDGSAVAAGRLFGLYPASDFRLTDGQCPDCPTIRQGLWYFERETIAVPKPGTTVASFAPGVPVADDLRAWLAGRSPGAGPEYPPLVWVAAPQVVCGARLSADAQSVDCAGIRLGFAPVPKIALNRSYFDPSSVEFLRQRSVRIRGRLDAETIVARTVWPEDFRLDASPPPHPLAGDLPSTRALRTLVRAEPGGGATSPYAAHTLWQREPAREAVPSGRAILGIMVNGAQGDDDEAHGGHFALVTGRTQPDGGIGDWLVNNFYTLDSESEKGILAAPVTLDNYLADLNSGQSWYRPSYMLVAVLADERAPALVQAALNRVYNQFWRHQLVYRHATMNCASISVDVLRILGWDIPARGPASRWLGALGFPLIALKERSIARARVAFDYLWEDQTRLLPAAAFEEAGASLLALAARTTTPSTEARLARILADDTETVAFLRFPQIPSSRVFGDAPAVTLSEYHARFPAEPGKAKIIPVPPRPFPDALRDPDLLPPPRPPSDYAAIVWGLLTVVGIPIWLHGWWKRRRKRSAPTPVS